METQKGSISRISQSKKKRLLNRPLFFQAKPYYTHIDPYNINSKGFLYWDPSKNMWNIGDILGATTIKFKTNKFTDPDCPADNLNLKQWQYSGTLAWKNDVGLAIHCLN